MTQGKSVSEEVVMHRERKGTWTSDIMIRKQTNGGWPWLWVNGGITAVLSFKQIWKGNIGHEEEPQGEEEHEKQWLTIEWTMRNRNSAPSLKAWKREMTEIMFPSDRGWLWVNKLTTSSGYSSSCNRDEKKDKSLTCYFRMCLLCSSLRICFIDFL